MKVTKYPQSCLLIEKDGQRIVIDPGSFFTAKYSLADLGDIKAALFTHEHRDHLDEKLIEELKANHIPIYGNTDVCAKIGDGAMEVQSGVGFTVAGYDIMPHDVPHFTTPTMQDPPQNTGYVIDGTFFHPGDSVKNDHIHAHDVAAPIAGGFTFDDTIDFAKSLQAKRLLPIHYSNHEMFPINPQDFVEKAKDEFEVILLDDGQSAEF